MEEFEPKKIKKEIPTDALVEKVISGIIELGKADFKGYNLVGVLDLRLRKKLTLQASGDILGISKEIVRQRQNRALRMLRGRGKITEEEADKIAIFLSSHTQSVEK